MHWKNWPYWVRGGIGASIATTGVVAVCIIVSMFSGSIGVGFALGFVIVPYAFFPNMLVNLLLGFDLLSLDAFNHSIILVLTLSVFWYFLMGAFLGYLYGKYKNHKLNTGSPPSRG